MMPKPATVFIGNARKNEDGSAIIVDTEMATALHRTTQLLHDILPRLSPADAKTMCIVSTMISENEKLLGGGHAL